MELVLTGPPSCDEKLDAEIFDNPLILPIRPAGYQAIQIKEVFHERQDPD